MTTPDHAQAFTVAQTVLHERQCRDRSWWDQMAQCFWPDSTVRLSWYDGDGPGFVAGSKAITESGLVTTHRMFSPVVRLTGSKALVEAPAAVSTSITVDGVRAALVSHSRLNYRVERRDGQWRILSLDSVYEQVSLCPEIPGESIAVAARDLAPFRPSYSLLAWDARRNGRSVDANLLGDDRPDDVSSFYNDLLHWLNG